MQALGCITTPIEREHPFRRPQFYTQPRRTGTKGNKNELCWGWLLRALKKLFNPFIRSEGDLKNEELIRINTRTEVF
jgi:hypothetical protein